MGALTFSTPYSVAVAADSPIAWWRLGESSGTNAADSSGNSRDGTYAGTPTLGAPGYTRDGNTAVTFNGTTDCQLSGAGCGPNGYSNPFCEWTDPFTGQCIMNLY